MDLDLFARTVDNHPDTVTPISNDLLALYAHFGMGSPSAMARQTVGEHLYREIAAAFSAGRTAAFDQSRALQKELILQHILTERPIDPYFAVLGVIMDALRQHPGTGDATEQDWQAAIRYATDHVRLKIYDLTAARERAYGREFAVARAAKRLQDAGYKFRIDAADVQFEPASESALISKLEGLIAKAGGRNVARRIFQAIAKQYDPQQERYHVIHHTPAAGGATPQVPFAYLVQLAVKHLAGTKPLEDTDQNWTKLVRLATDYTTVLDIQNYYPTIWAQRAAPELLRLFQQMALYDTLFRFIQMRGSDVATMLRELLAAYDMNAAGYGSGWSLNNIVALVESILTYTVGQRGPVMLDQRTLVSICPRVSSERIAFILDEALCHPVTGANQRYKLPMDLPQVGEAKSEQTGYDFFLRPLLRLGSKLVLLDRAICAIAYVEAVLTVMRQRHKQFDGDLGTAIERFLENQFVAHGIGPLSGNYRVDGKDGECDLVIETDKTVIFIECKKKALTRAAKAGTDAHVLFDLTKSLLAAQVQAGWHEVLLRRHGHLDLTRDGTTRRLELRGRGVERIAVTLFDFGSFQDRVLSEQFLEANLRSTYSVNDPNFKKAVDELNGLLAELRTQIMELHAGEAELRQPFFNCWFLSVPQLLVFLDGVKNPEELREALWGVRHIHTGSSDAYFDMSYMRKLRAAKA